MLRNRMAAVLPFLIALGCASTSMTPRANTRDAITSYVNAAADYVAKNGPSCDTFSSSRWRTGDYYIFVIGPDNRTVCHPTLVAKPSSDIVDANGRHVGDEIVAAANAGGGWVNYNWPRPGQTTPVAKSTYAKKVTGPDGQTYIVGSGGYELP